MSPGWHGSWGMAGCLRQQWVPGHLSGFTWQLAPAVCRLSKRASDPCRPRSGWRTVSTGPRASEAQPASDAERHGPSCRQELPSHCHGAQRWGRPGSSSGCRSTRQPRLHHRVTHQTSHLAFVVGGRRVGGAVSAGQWGANFQLLLVKSWHHFHERTETWAERFLLFAGRSILVLLRARSPQAPLRSSSLQSSLLSEVGIRSQAAGVSACWDPAPGSRALKSIWNSLPCNVNGHGEGSEIPAKPLP